MSSAKYLPFCLGAKKLEKEVIKMNYFYGIA